MNFKFAGSIFVLASGLLAMNLACAETIKPLTDMEAAKALAKETGEKILIEFTGSDWCDSCIALEKEVLMTPRFQKFMQDYIYVQIDMPGANFRGGKEEGARIRKRNEPIVAAFGVTGFPTVVIADERGSEVERWIGYAEGMGPERYIQKLAADMAWGTYRTRKLEIYRFDRAPLITVLNLVNLLNSRDRALLDNEGAYPRIVLDRPSEEMRVFWENQLISTDIPSDTDRTEVLLKHLKDHLNITARHEAGRIILTH